MFLDPSIDIIKLRLTHNAITQLAGLERLVNLDELTLSDNPIGSESLQCLQSLTRLNHLSLAGCQLTSFPAVLMDLPELRYLDLSMNQLTNLHSDLFHRLSRLQFLDVSHNQLSSLPSRGLSISRYLKELKLNNNRIQTLPDDITQLHWLTTLALDNNPLNALPTNMVALSDIVQIIIDGIWAQKIGESLQNISYMQPSARFDIGYSETFGMREDMEDGIVIQGAFGGRKV